MEVENTVLPTLTATISALIVLAAVAARTSSRSRSARKAAELHTMALERGLGTNEIQQLEDLSRLLQHSTMLDLLVSPQRFNIAAARYIDQVRSNGATEAQYFGHILEITRLRRRVHPPQHILRHLDTTRELREGLSVDVVIGGAQVEAVIWTVNEDHIDLRFRNAVNAVPTMSLICRVPGVLGVTQLFASAVRCVTDPSRNIVRVEHNNELQMVVSATGAQGVSRTRSGYQTHSSWAA